MRNFEFAVIATGLNREADDFETRFFDAGCDDATVSFQKGNIILDFDREAETFAKAIFSAIEQIRGVGAKPLRVEPDPLVSLADIAERTKLTRAALSQYALGQRREGFPAPVRRITSSTPLWRWSEVTEVLAGWGKLSPDAVEQARAVEAANRELECA